MQVLQLKRTGRGINTAVTKGMEVLPGKVGTALIWSNG